MFIVPIFVIDVNIEKKIYRKNYMLVTSRADLSRSG